jgi:2-keto-4-pentenoate hydratase/2-oxohepta-3-ene-1,7-dioic acid hydratase in catechol pathway
MKLATFLDGTIARIGIVHQADSSVFSVAAAAERAGDPYPAFASMLALIDAGPAALDAARGLFDRFASDPSLNHPLSSVKLWAPVPQPRQIRDFSVFPGHVRQAPVGMRKLAARLQGLPVPDVKAAETVPAAYRDHAIYYKGNRFSVVGHEHDVLWPRYSQVMDYELEFGIFLGRGGVNIPKKEARQHIFGYTIFNDFSARDAQMHEMRAMLGPTKGKDFDTGNAIGPWIVTADEIPDPYSLRMTARVNGEIWSQGTSAGMLHDYEDMIAYVTRDETIHAGEFFGSGTMGGGCGLELDRYLSHGDAVELEVERIGTLRNRVFRRDQPHHQI